MFGDLYGQTLKFELADGDKGTLQTLAVMWATIDDAAKSPIVDRLARELERGTDTEDEYCRAVYAWLVQRVPFKRDPWMLEYVRHPEQLIADAAGGRLDGADCDDVATLGASLLAARGVDPVLIVVGRRPQAPYEHVFFGRLASINRRPTVVTMDPQERIPIGQWPTGIARRAVFGHPTKWGFQPLKQTT